MIGKLGVFHNNFLSVINSGGGGYIFRHFMVSAVIFLINFLSLIKVSTSSGKPKSEIVISSSDPEIHIGDTVTFQLESDEKFGEIEKYSWYYKHPSVSNPRTVLCWVGKDAKVYYGLSLLSGFVKACSSTMISLSNIPMELIQTQVVLQIWKKYGGNIPNSLFVYKEIQSRPLKLNIFAKPRILSGDYDRRFQVSSASNDEASIDLNIPSSIVPSNYVECNLIGCKVKALSVCPEATEEEVSDENRMNDCCFKQTDRHLVCQKERAVKLVSVGVKITEDPLNPAKESYFMSRMLQVTDLAKFECGQSGFKVTFEEEPTEYTLYFLDPESDMSIFPKWVALCNPKSSRKQKCVLNEALVALNEGRFEYANKDSKQKVKLIVRICLKDATACVFQFTYQNRKTGICSIDDDTYEIIRPITVSTPITKVSTTDESGARTSTQATGTTAGTARKVSKLAMILLIVFGILVFVTLAVILFIMVYRRIGVLRDKVRFY